MAHLAGHRVHLVPFREHDRLFMTVALNDPKAWGNRQLPDDPVGPLTEGQMDRALKAMSDPEHGELFVVQVADEPVGHCGTNTWWDAATPDVVLFIAPQRRRSGFGTEAMRLLLEHVFTTSVAEVAHAWAPSWAEECGRFLPALGFVEAGRSRRAGLRDGAWYDAVAFDLLREEWEVMYGA